MTTYQTNRSTTQTLTGTAADQITLTQRWGAVRVTNLHASNYLWVTPNDVVAVAAADGTIPVPPNTSRVIDAAHVAGARTMIVGVVGNGNQYTVEGLFGSEAEVLSSLASEVSEGLSTASPAMLGNFLTVGEENMPRDLAQGQPALGNTTLVFSYFTARKSHTITQLRTVVGSTASTGATLCRMGLYTVAANGDLTLVAACANDATLWSGSTGTVYTRSIVSPASYGIVKGQRYACAALCVGASPLVHGASPIGNTNALWTTAPAIAGGLATQNDLPASVLGTSVAAAPRRIYMEMLP